MTTHHQQHQQHASACLVHLVVCSVWRHAVRRGAHGLLAHLTLSRKHERVGGNEQSKNGNKQGRICQAIAETDQKNNR